MRARRRGDRDELDPGATHRRHEPVGDPRDPQADRAAGRDLVRRRPALARHLPARGDARGLRARAARGRGRRRAGAPGAAVRGERRPRPAARMARRRPAAPRPRGRRRECADHHRLAAGARPAGQGAARRRQPGAGRVADLPRRAAGLRADAAALRRRARATRTGRCDDGAGGAAHGRARFLYLLPNFQNPTGRSIGEARRAALVAARRRHRPAARRGQPVRRPLVRRAAAAPLAGRDPDGAVYLGSFSKVLAPGLRLGYLVAPPAMLPKLLQAKQAADLHTPSFNQRVVARSHRAAASSTRHVPTIRALLQVAARRDARGARPPHAGRRRALEQARTAACSSGSSCRRAAMRARCCRRRSSAASPSCPARRSTPTAPRCRRAHLRLSFVTAGAEQIETGIAALAGARTSMRGAEAGRAPLRPLRTQHDLRRYAESTSSPSSPTSAIRSPSCSTAPGSTTRGCSASRAGPT